MFGGVLMFFDRSMYVYPFLLSLNSEIFLANFFSKADSSCEGLLWGMYVHPIP